MVQEQSPPDCKAFVGLAAVAAVLLAAPVAYEHVFHQPATKLLADSSLACRLACYVELALLAAASILWDIQQSSEPRSLKRAAASIFAVLVVIFPMGAFLQPIVHFLYWCCIVIGVLAFLVFLALDSIHIWDPKVLAGFVFCLCIFIVHKLEPHAAEIMVIIPFLLFLAREVCCKSMTGDLGMLTAPFAPLPEPELCDVVLSWGGTSLVHPGSKEFREQRDAFDSCCAGYSHKYPFHLHLEKLIRVKPDKQPGHANFIRPTRTQNGRLLFHGTTRGSAKGILDNGFRLPNDPGMFGKGVYFADCPLKSWQYTRERTDGLMLWCWVDLGNPRHLKRARTELTRPPHRTFKQWLKRERKYGSVVGDEMEVGGELRVPEYVIYDPKNAEVDYICVVKRVEQGTPYAPYEDVSEDGDQDEDENGSEAIGP